MAYAVVPGRHNDTAKTIAITSDSILFEFIMFLPLFIFRRIAIYINYPSHSNAAFSL